MPPAYHNDTQKSTPDAKKDKVMALGMLCMAKIGESRDPLFSTMRFPEGYGINDFEDEQLQAGLIGIDLASQIVQVWNHDLMKSVDPELAHQSAVEMLDALEPKSEVDVPDDMYYFVGYAVCNAVVARGKYEDLTGRLLNVKLLIDQKCDSATAEMAGDLAFSFENVARLPEGSNDALKLYEDYVQKAMMIMELPVYPKIEIDPKTDLNAWTFSMIS